MLLDQPTSIHARSTVATIPRKSSWLTVLSVYNGSMLRSIGVWDTNGVPITNNVIYNTYESALVVAGQNNIVQKNLVSTVYWSGTAQPQYAEFNINNDGAIMSKKAISVVMRVRFLFTRTMEIIELCFLGQSGIWCRTVGLPYPRKCLSRHSSF